MKQHWKYVCLVGLVVGFVSCGTPAFAFIGDYISQAEGDRAVIAAFTSSDIGYDSDLMGSGDIDRKLFSIGLSKSFRPPVKVFGSLHYTFDGEMGGGGNDLDAGYSISAGGSYMFWDRHALFFQTYGQFNYIFEETFEFSGPDMGNLECSLDGYEFLFGVMGTMKLHSHLNLYGYGAFELIPLSAITVERRSSALHDSPELEREVMFGFKAGLLYDFLRWFIKTEAKLGSEMAFILAAGVKF